MSRQKFTRRPELFRLPRELLCMVLLSPDGSRALEACRALRDTWKEYVVDVPYVLAAFCTRKLPKDCNTALQQLLDENKLPESVLCRIAPQLLLQPDETGGAWQEDEDAALDYAAFHGHLGLVQLLLEAGADPRGRYTVDNAVHSQNAEIVSAILEAGVDPEDILRATQEDGYLFEAVQDGCIDILQMLLDAGLDPNASNGRLLVGAVKHRRVGIVRMLLDKGADAHRRVACASPGSMHGLMGACMWMAWGADEA